MSDIKNKIKKLLELGSADRNLNEHERRQAMEMANKLLEEHNLSLADVNGHFFEEVKAGEQALTLNVEPWVSELVCAVNEMTFTDSFYRTKTVITNRGSLSRKKFFVLVGTPENLAVALDLVTWLVKSIKKEANQRYQTPVSRRAFCCGMAHGLWLQAQEAKRAKQQTNGTGTQLMVVKNALEKANDEYLAGLNLGKSRQRGSTIADVNAFYAGQAVGKSMQLNKQLASPTRRITAG